MSFWNRAVDLEALSCELNERKQASLDQRSGRNWGYAYFASQSAKEIGERAYCLFLSENGIDPTLFPNLLDFENQVLGICRRHLRGNDEVVGAFTSGGTESILLAVKAARDFARQQRPHISRPEMVFPVTAHAAFHKAAHYLGVKPIVTGVCASTLAADPAQIESAITSNTILVAASAPSYAHGVIDPISRIADVALAHDLLFHVDACIDGFLLPYFSRLGSEHAEFDFEMPGVTSISMDLHKYAFAPKGASVVLYRDSSLRRFQYFCCADWPGYTVFNATLAGSKPGGPVAAAWSVLHHIGDAGYLALAELVKDASAEIIGGINAIDGLRVLGAPQMSLVAFASDTVDIFEIADELRARGWYVMPQLRSSAAPQSLHLTVTPANAPGAKAFLADLAECVVIASDGDSGATASMESMLDTIDFSTVDQTVLSNLLAMVGVVDGKLPERQAGLNRILNVLAPNVRATLVTEFFNGSYR